MLTEKKYRTINKNEIIVLEHQGCFADDWTTVLVKDGFNPSSVRNSHFSGDIKIGIFNDKIEIEQGIYKATGIYNSFIQNCEIENNCLISNVRTLANYCIEENVVIDNVGSLVISGESCFGNGVIIETLNEAGGRELMIYDKLTAQIAYIMVMYRHDTELIDTLKKLIENYVDTKVSSVGIIEKHVHIANAISIKNVNIGESARIDGALLLDNGSICSTALSPVIVGNGVSAKNFIIHSGTKVDGSAVIKNCFIGQGVQMGRQFTADNSVFFANCEAFQSEVCSVFAGPYTVTHHKSTLLIAGLFSFYNAGSGTNQSNHMYKLGPIHQGILERGTKTGSMSYLLWPSRVGAYSNIIGKHTSNFDTSDFPFSYLSEMDGKTKLTPAFNLVTVGTKRDSQKWPKRDRRKDDDKLDLINFDLYNPYIVHKLMNGIDLLKQLNEKSGKDQEYVIHKGTVILKTMIKNAIKYYEMAIRTYIGNEIIHKLGDFEHLDTIESIRAKLKLHSEEFSSRWIDLSGMIVPQEILNGILNSVKSSAINSVETLAEALRAEFLNYRKYAWAWCANLIKEFNGFSVNSILANELEQLITDWKKSAVQLNKSILKDAEIEFNKNRKIGYGIDGDEEVKNKDFEMVQGLYSENKFVVGILRENTQITTKADKLIAVLQKLQ